jgi:predicted flap endonuclease-1-like 5' DNA nuclease
VLRQFRDTFTSYRDGEEIRRWLRGWIDKHPLTGFCFLADELATLSAEELADEQVLVNILFYLVQDCRNSYLTCACFACGAGSGVPLARVCLRPSPNGNGGCSVLDIDGYPPYRRPLRQPCWPALPGTVNGARVIWHRWEDACLTLAELGVALNHREEFTFPRTLAKLANVLRRSPFLECGERATPQVLSGPVGHRVVGFWNAPNDDLTRISGIGERRAEQLSQQGIRSYDDFTAAPYDQLREVFPATVSDEIMAAMREQARDLADE